MKKYFQKHSKLAILTVLFVVCFSLRLNGINLMGRTWDEPEYVEQGYNLTELIGKGDFNNPYFYTTYDHPPLIKYLYGITSHLDVANVNTGNPVFNYDYTYSRALSALMFSIGMLFVVLICWKLFPNLQIGIIAGLILSLLPFTIGLSQLVTTESLKLLIYPMVIYSYLFLLDKISTKNIIISGILTGFALQAKQSDALLLVLLGIALLLQYKNNLRDVFKTMFSITLISLLTFIAIWPQSLFHIHEIMAINQKLWSVKFSPNLLQFTLSPPEVFLGKLMLTPIFYYVVYFFITIPAVILFLFIVGIRYLFKTLSVVHVIILLWFFLPFVLSFYSWRQHGLRYIIEIYPAIAIIAAYGLDKTLNMVEDIRKRLAICVLLIAYLTANLWYVSPYYLDYFNEVVGGTATVYRYNLFQIGWWGQGEREAAIYIQNNAMQGSTVGLALSPSFTYPRTGNLKYKTYQANKKYDYVVVNQYHIIRDGFNVSDIKRDYNLVYSVKAGGAILVYVYKLKN